MNNVLSVSVWGGFGAVLATAISVVREGALGSQDKGNFLISLKWSLFEPSGASKTKVWITRHGNNVLLKM